MDADNGRMMFWIVAARPAALGGRAFATGVALFKIQDRGCVVVRSSATYLRSDRVASALICVAWASICVLSAADLRLICVPATAARRQKGAHAA
jgi:hypothetical protein